MNYYNILALLKKSNIDFATECLAAMSYDPVIMISGELIVNDEFIQIYRHRRDLQEIQRNKVVLGYDLMINQLHLIPIGTLINFTTVYTIKNCYIITHSMSNCSLCV